MALQKISKIRTNYGKFPVPYFVNLSYQKVALIMKDELTLVRVY